MENERIPNPRIGETIRNIKEILTDAGYQMKREDLFEKATASRKSPEEIEKALDSLLQSGDIKEITKGEEKWIYYPRG